MKIKISFSLISKFSVVCFILYSSCHGCNSKQSGEPVKKRMDTGIVQDNKPKKQTGPERITPQLTEEIASFLNGPKVINGTVEETMDSGGYTYIRVNNVWIAGPKLKVAAGDEVTFEKGLLMRDFKSKTLNRTFAYIFFSGRLIKKGEEGVKTSALPHGHPVLTEKNSESILPVGHPAVATGKAKKVAMETIKVKKAEGGQTIAELFLKKNDFADKEVKIRGKVVKFTENILGFNWIHIQDGTGKEGTDDLTLTSKSVVSIGDIVTIKGILKTDKDFGAGYKYAILIEDASVIVEKVKQ